MCDNPRGPRDPMIRTCVWLDEQGVPLAALWSFACHPVGFPDPDTASADFIGVVREKLRSQLGARVPVIFAPGCMGDVRPRSPRPWAQIDRIVRIALSGPCPVSFDRGEWDAWASGLAAEVCAIDSAGELAPIRVAPAASPRRSIPISHIFEGECPVPELVAKSLRVPGVGRILTLSCEPVTEIADLVRDHPDDLVLGYEGDVFGYLPTDAMVAEGGYEAERFMPYFGLRGSWRPHLDETVAALGASLRQ